MTRNEQSIKLYDLLCNVSHLLRYPSKMSYERTYGLIFTHGCARREKERNAFKILPLSRSLSLSLPSLFEGNVTIASDYSPTMRQTFQVGRAWMRPERIRLLTESWKFIL